MDPLSQNFIAHLYTQGPLSTQQVDESIDYWNLQKRRGRSVTFPEILVERGLMEKSVARKIIKDLQGAKRKTRAKPAKSGKVLKGKAVNAGSGQDSGAVGSGLNLWLYIAVFLLGIVVLFFVVQKITVTVPAPAPEFGEPRLLIDSPGEQELEQEAAEALARARNFGAAAKKLRGLLGRSDLADSKRRLLRDRLLRFESLEKSVGRVDKLRRELRVLIKGARFDEARRAIEGVLREYPGLRNEPEGKELSENLALLAKTRRVERSKVEKPVVGAGGRRAEGSKTGSLLGAEGKGEPERALSRIQLTRAREIESGRGIYFKKSLWDGRYERAQSWLKGERARALDLRKREQAKAQKRSLKQRLTVRLTSNYEIRDAVVKGYDEKGFSLSTKGGEFGFRWDLADRQLAFEVRELGLLETSAASLFRFAKFCVKRRFFKQARRAFRRAGELDERYRSRIPKLELVEKAAQAFHGEVTRLGGELVRFQYRFINSNEQLDWVISRFAPLFRRGQLIVENGKNNKFNLIGLKGVDFHDFARITLTLGSTKKSVAAMMLFADNFGIQATYYRDRGILDLYDLKAQRPFTKPFKVKKGARRLRMTLRGRRLIVQLGNKEAATFNVPSLETFKVQFGGRGSAGQIAFADFRIEGRVSQVWLRKTFQEAEDIIAAILVEGGVGAPQSAWDRRAELLSADQPGPRTAGEKRLFKGLTEARKLLRRPQGSLEQAHKILTKVISLAPENGSAYYERGRTLFYANLMRNALYDLNRAVALRGGFHEALAMRARVLIILERLDEARADIKKAFSFRRDSAQALLAQSELDYKNHKIKAAQQLLALGFVLWPRDSGIATNLRNFTHVVNGPPWENRHRIESEHYIVFTDISESRGRFYSERLEWIHSFYQQQFPYSVRGKKSRAFIFNTEEGYQQYANLTRNSRVESTLGYFHPGFNQLLLFEDSGGSIEETLDTLYHEGFHQFISGVCKELPLWANEGLAEYYGPTRFNQYGEVKAVGALNPLRVPFLKEYRGRGYKYLSFKDLMNQSLRQFQSGNLGIKYAQSWAMIHFFKHGKKGRKGLFNKYFELIRRGQSADFAYRQSYGKLDLGSFERDWQGYLNRMLKRSGK
jgi:tetratricopeptide (TPR) repeat protein